MLQTKINNEWWEHMELLMETNEGNSPVVSDLTEVFRL